MCIFFGPGGLFSSPKIPDQYTKPSGLYASDKVDLRRLKRLILEGKLAPCFPGQDNATVQPEIRAVVRKILKHRAQAATPDAEECPICMMYYPVMNTSRCCGKRVCTDCFLQVQVSTPPHSEPLCPFCKVPGYTAKFLGALSAEDLEKDRIEEQNVIEARIRERKEEIMRDDARALQRQQEQELRAAQAAAAPPPPPPAPVVQQPPPGASDRQHAAAAAAAAASQRSRTPLAPGLPESPGVPQLAMRGVRHEWQNRLNEYVPANVVGIADNVHDINDLMLEQAIYDSLSQAGAQPAELARVQPVRGRQQQQQHHAGPVANSGQAASRQLPPGSQTAAPLTAAMTAAMEHAANAARAAAVSAGGADTAPVVHPAAAATTSRTTSSSSAVPTGMPVDMGNEAANTLDSGMPGACTDMPAGSGDLRSNRARSSSGGPLTSDAAAAAAPAAVGAAARDATAAAAAAAASAGEGEAAAAAAPELGVGSDAASTAVRGQPVAESTVSGPLSRLVSLGQLVARLSMSGEPRPQQRQKTWTVGMVLMGPGHSYPYGATPGQHAGASAGTVQGCTGACLPAAAPVMAYVENPDGSIGVLKRHVSEAEQQAVAEAAAAATAAAQAAARAASDYADYDLQADYELEPAACLSPVHSLEHTEDIDTTAPTGWLPHAASESRLLAAIAESDARLAAEVAREDSEVRKRLSEAAGR